MSDLIHVEFKQLLIELEAWENYKKDFKEHSRHKEVNTFLITRAEEVFLEDAFTWTDTKSAEYWNCISNCWNCYLKGREAHTKL